MKRMILGLMFLSHTVNAQDCPKCYPHINVYAVYSDNTCTQMVTTPLGIVRPYPGPGTYFVAEIGEDQVNQYCKNIKIDYCGY